jgi:hypothetical protein
MSRSGDYEKIFQQISLELRTQYSLGYHSNNPAKDGKFRQVKIIPKNANHLVRARKGYYAANGASGR